MDDVSAHLVSGSPSFCLTVKALRAISVALGVPSASSCQAKKVQISSP